MRRKSTHVFDQVNRAKVIHPVIIRSPKNPWSLEIILLNFWNFFNQDVKFISQNLGKRILLFTAKNGAEMDHIANLIAYDDYQFINDCFRPFMCALTTIRTIFSRVICNKMRTDRYSYVLASYIAMNHGIVILLLFMNEC